MAENSISTEDPLRRLNRPFDKMFAAEIKQWVSKLPKNRDKKFKNPDHPDPRNELVGLAMSGGGMRSATYNLGVGQALARHNLMKDVDYISTVSGGGYYGSSLTSLMADDLPYNDDWDARLDTSGENFPYAFPAPLEGKHEDADYVPVHGQESPATRHIRENSNLLMPSVGLAGLFQTETWTAISRYLVSTALLLALYLLPSITGLLLLTFLIPNAVWVRFDPLGTGGTESWLANNLWFLTIPLWFLGVVALLAVISPRQNRSGDQFAPDWVRQIQRRLIFLFTVTGGAVLLVLGLWGYNFAINDSGIFLEFAMGMGAMGGASGTAMAIGVGKIMAPGRVKRVIGQLLFAVGGVLILGFGLVVWSYYLFVWLAHPQLNQTLLDGYGIYWGGWLLALDGVIFALLVTGIWGHQLLNFLAIHNLYERRLRRSWIIGAIPVRPPGAEGVPHPDQGWSRVWIRPDIKMAGLLRERVVSPIQLICTTLNIPGSTGPKLLDRKGDSFVVSPVYSGSALTRWMPTKDLSDISEMELARAMAISGAAESPNMGRQTTPLLSVIYTIFNIRLGWWIKNPRPTDKRGRLTVFAPWWLYWKEMLGKASHKDRLIYLSDGGHFENLGIYELLRRRCKYIIAVDATGEPPDPHEPLNFGGLGIPVRRARIDFGVEVDIDLAPLMRDPETGFVKSHFAVGTISYPRQDRHGSDDCDDEDTGTLVLIKSGRVKDSDTADILNYARQVNGEFPHDTTADQQFSSPQFESYRQLGYEAGSVVAKIAESAGVDATAAEKFRMLHKKYKHVIAQSE